MNNNENLPHVDYFWKHNFDNLITHGKDKELNGNHFSCEKLLIAVLVWDIYKWIIDKAFLEYTSYQYFNRAC